MAVKSFDDVNGNGITRDAALDSGDVFDSRAKNTNYGGTGGANITLIYYQGTGSAARKVGSTGGHGFTVGPYTSRDQTATTYRHVIPKMWITNYTALNPAGIDFGVGSGLTTAIGNDQHWWTVGDDGTIDNPDWKFPDKGGFIIKPIDTQLRAFLRGSSGTPTETAMLNFMAWVDLANTGGTDRNLVMDSPDYVETGFHAVGGDSTDPDITFADFVAEDEGATSTNFARAGLWQTNQGIIQWFGGGIVGRTYAGTSTASGFTDSFQTLVCPGGYAGAGFNKLEFDITNASTIVSLDNIAIIGQGRSGLKRLFDATDSGSGGDVNVTLDEIAYAGHGFNEGDQVLYSREGNTGYVTGAANNGESELVTGTTGEYYYVIVVDVDTFAVASSFANALAATRLALTAQTGETHSFERTPDNRPDFLVTSDAAPGTFAMSNSSLTSCREITFDTGCDISDTQFITSQKLFLNEGTLADCVINAPTVYENEAFILSDTLFATSTADGAIAGCNFIAGPDGGHAIELTATGTYAFDANTFSGYLGTPGTNLVADSGSSSAAIYNNSGGAITLSITGSGDSPSIRNGATSTTTVTNSVTLTLTGIETDSEVRIINLEDVENFNKELAGSEQILGEVQSATIADGGSGYTNGAQVLTVVGGTGTAATINVTVAGGIVTSVDSIATPGSYTVNPPTPATTTGGGGTGCTLRLDVSGDFEYTYDASLGVLVAIIVFHLQFREVRIEQIIPAVNATIPIQQGTDRTYSNP
jgi:hypothetical protein